MQARALASPLLLIRRPQFLRSHNLDNHADADQRQQRPDLQWLSHIHHQRAVRDD